MAITNFSKVDVSDANGFSVAGVPITSTPAELNVLSGTAVTSADLVKLHAVTLTAQQINWLAGLIGPDGNFLLGTPQWDDLRFPAAGINPPGAATDPTLDNTNARYIFSASATNVLAVHVQLPHEWVEGSTIEPHIHWSPSNTNTGNVLWRLEYKVANIGEAFPAGYTTINTLTAGSGTADMHQLADLGSIPMVGKIESCMMIILLSRIGGDGTDTFTGTAALNEFDIHILKNTLGSHTEFAK